MAAAPLKVGQRVLLIGKNYHGTVLFNGEPAFAPGIWIGVALDEPQVSADIFMCLFLLSWSFIFMRLGSFASFKTHFHAIFFFAYDRYVLLYTLTLKIDVCQCAFHSRINSRELKLYHVIYVPCFFLP